MVSPSRGLAGSQPWKIERKLENPASVERFDEREVWFPARSSNAKRETIPSIPFRLIPRIQGSIRPIYPSPLPQVGGVSVLGQGHVLRRKVVFKVASCYARRIMDRLMRHTSYYGLHAFILSPIWGEYREYHPPSMVLQKGTKYHSRRQQSNREPGSPGKPLNPMRLPETPDETSRRGMGFSAPSKSHQIPLKSRPDRRQ